MGTALVLMNVARAQITQAEQLADLRMTNCRRRD